MQDVLNQLAEEHPQALLADGFEQAFLGICRRFGQEPVAAYSYEKCINILVLEGMSEDEAVDYFEFNVIGSWVGVGTPVFIQTHC